MASYHGLTLLLSSLRVHRRRMWTLKPFLCVLYGVFFARFAQGPVAAVRCSVKIVGREELKGG